MLVPVMQAANGSPIDWLDTATRLRWAVRDGVTASRPFNDAENAAVDAMLRPGLAQDHANQTCASIAAGVASIQAARQSASDDIAVAQQAKTNTLTVKSAITARKTAVSGSTPLLSLAYVTAIRDELTAVYGYLEQIAQALDRRRVLDTGGQQGGKGSEHGTGLTAGAGPPASRHWAPVSPSLSTRARPRPAGPARPPSRDWPPTG